MKIDWLLFLPALLLLFYPLDDWLRMRVCLRDYEYIRNTRLRSREAWWRQPWAWVDPLRAFVGAWMLRHAWEIELPLPALWRQGPLIGTLLVLGLAVIVQMHTRRHDEVLLAPMGYCAGLVFALLRPEIALLVVTLAGACMMAFRGWAAFFGCAAAGSAVFGYMLLHVNFWMLGTVGLMIEPLLFSWLLGRQMLLPVARWPEAETKVVMRKSAPPAGEPVRAR